MKNKKAYNIYLLYSFATALFFALVFTVNMYYFVTVARLDPLQLVLVGTALELSVFIFEIPTGVVADSYSRRLSVIIGMFLIGIGFVTTALFPSFIPILLAQLFWGVGYTFTSGAQQAWITDEIGEEYATHAFLRGSQFEQIGALLGTGLSVLLAAVYLTLPILTGGIMFFILGIFLIVVMPEDGFTPTPTTERNSWQHLASVFKQGFGMVSRRPALLAILGVGFFYGLYSEGDDRLWTASLLERFQFPPMFNLPDVTWFGILAALALIFSAAGTEILQRRLKDPQPAVLARTLMIVSALLVASLVGFVLTGSFVLAVVLYLAISILRTLASPLYTSWVNHRLDSQVRATVISMSSQVDALGQISGGPVIGVIARQTSIGTGMLISSLLLSPVLLLLMKQVKAKEA